ncbi:MAG: B12-binding domain-containing radical SAM protein [Candidatus Doudnabacteria bacterium]|nr:B12-binding domain-containing radical SAM protein [Candidatus Doudnabacteria bacterium]
MKVQLVVPALEGFKYTRKSGCPPLGIASIASYLKRHADADVEILDGEMIADNKTIVSRISSGALVGVLTKTPNYPGAVRIAEGAKANGCTVVFGGVYASNMAQAIMQHRHTVVDFVVRGFGEKPMLRILEMIRSGQQFPEKRILLEPAPCFDEMGWPSRGWFDMEQYIANFAADRPSWNLAHGTNLFTHMGCVHKCDFCSRMGPLGGGVYWREPKNIWAEVRELVSSYGIDYVLDFSDTLTQNRRWLQALVEARPYDLEHIRWHVFATAKRIPDSIELLKLLNVAHVFVGVETGDELISQNVLKGRRFSPQLVRNGISLLVEAGIRVTPSFVYGLRGETPASMERTFRFAQELVALAGAEEVFASELIPWPGAPAWETVRQFFGGTDLLEVEALKEVWLREVVHLSPVHAREYVNNTLALAKYPISVQGKEDKQ